MTTSIWRVCRAVKAAGWCGIVAAILSTTNARADLTVLRDYQGIVPPADMVYGGNSGTSSPVIEPGTDPSIGKYVVSALGQDLWERADAGSFLHDADPVTGDFSAIVRVSSIVNPGGGTPAQWGRAGLMVRADPAADHSPNFAIVRRTSDGGEFLESTVTQNRDAFGAGSGEPFGFGGSQDDGGFNNTTPQWLSIGRTGGQFYAAFAADVGGAPGSWNRANPFGVVPALSGDIYLGLATQGRKDQGKRQLATYENFTRVDEFLPEFFQADPRGGNLLPAAPLPGIGPASMMWGIREVRDIGGAANVGEAASKIAGGTGTIFEGLSQYVNHTDPTTNPSAGKFGNDAPFISDAHTGNTDGPVPPYNAADPEDDQDVLMVGHARIRVTPAQAGIWSFGVHTDDGFAMRIRDSGGNLMPWGMTDGAGGVYGADRSELSFPDPTGDSNTRGTMNLPAGNYDVEFVSYENAGGANWEVYHAQGVVLNDGASNWRLLGAKPDPAKQYFKPTMAPLDDQGNHFDITVVDSTPDNTPAHSVAQARSILDNPGANPVFQGLAPVINHKDPEAGVCCGGLDNGDLAWPGLADGVDNEDYATRSLGVLQMPADGYVRFHIQSDDGFGLHIDDAQFSILSAAGGPTYLADAGTSVNADYGTGNTNTVLEAFIPAGEHFMEFIHWDGCCGSYAEVYVGGLAGQDGMLLGSFNDPIDLGIIAGPQVLALVPEPSSYVLAALGFAGIVALRRRRK